MEHIRITNEFFTFQPMDDPRFEYRGTVVQGIHARSPYLQDEIRRVIAARLDQMIKEHGPGWVPYFLYVGDETRLRQTFIGPILFWRRARLREKPAVDRLV